ncbi:MAG: peptidoglycan bridge formation glycyltransferase FemA/FemB family protein [Candidatus Roizmanbacteria bacterium]
MPDWNTHVDHPMQSWEWGDIRTSEGKQVIRFIESEHEIHTNSHQVQAVYQMTLHPIPYTSYSIGYIPKSKWPSEEFLRYAKKYAHTHHILFIKFEPHTLDPLKHSKEYRANNSLLIRSAHPLFTPWTQTLDLTPSEEDLLKSMHTKTRYNIRLAEKKGIVVKQMSDENGYAIFEKLYFDTCKRQKYHGHTPTYHRNIWDHIKYEAMTSDSKRVERDHSHLEAHILIAFFQNEPLAAFQIWHFKDMIYYTYGGSSESHRNLMAPNLLMWEVIRLGKHSEATSLDMWGSLPPDFDASDPWAGFTRFKQGYGTQFVQSPGSFDLPINPYLYKTYNLVQKIRTRVLSVI